MTLSTEQDYIADMAERLTEDEARKKWHGKRIAPEKRPEIAAILPEKMHIDSSGVVRYLAGKNPNGLAQLSPENGFKPGQSGNPAGRQPTPKPLQSSYRKALFSRIKHPTKRGRKQVFSDLLAQFHIEAILASIKASDYALFNRLATDFRLNAGEIPTQETENRHEIEGNPYDNAQVQDLVKLCKTLLERYEPPQKALALAEVVQSRPLSSGNGTPQNEQPRSLPEPCQSGESANTGDLEGQSRIGNRQE